MLNSLKFGRNKGLPSILLVFEVSIYVQASVGDTSPGSYSVVLRGSSSIKRLLYLSLAPTRRTKLPAHFPYFTSTHPITSYQVLLGFLRETTASALAAVNPDQAAPEGNKKSESQPLTLLNSPENLVSFRRISNLLSA
jgi:hypothetical protein